MRHLDEGTLHAWLDRDRSGLPPDAAAEVEGHLDGCAECRADLDRARAVRGRAAEILAGAAPGDVAAPPFAVIAARAGQRGPGGRRAGPARRPLVALAWAASVVAAVGLGWAARDLLRSPREVAVREAAAPAAPAADAVAASAPLAAPAAAGPAWTPATRAEAERRLGAPLLTVAGLPVQGVEVGEIGGEPAARVVQPLQGGGALELFQRRTAAEPGSGEVSIRRGALLVSAAAPLPADSIRALLERASGEP